MRIKPLLKYLPLILKPSILTYKLPILALKKPRLPNLCGLQLEKDYTLNLVRLFTPKSASTQAKVQSSAKQETNSTWKFALKTLEVKEANFQVLLVSCLADIVLCLNDAL